ncbi:MAG: hypothetical protein ACRC2O_10455 [Chitinophagaceae bacterium]
MKNLLFLSLFAILPFQKNLNGAWELKEGTITHTLVIADDYFSITSFDISRKIFLQTEGGTCIRKGEQLEGKIEFNTNDKSTVGSVYAWPLQSINPVMTIIRDGKKEAWTRTDDGTGLLAGNWRISGRDQKGTMIEIKPAARKTIKLLTGKRFQWAAINTETGEFFGTGGGRYSFENGKYTEYIEFFSRDSSRVGMSLSFDGRVEGRNWYHSGKSSKGDPISEVWSH